jgi:hypothetical protein
MPSPKGRQTGTPAATGKSEKGEGTTRKINMLTEFNTHILNYEEHYGVQLSCKIERNVRTTNGDVNQWIGEVWYYDGPTQILTSATATTFNDMINALLGNLHVMLTEHGQTTGQTRRAAA